MRASLVDDIGRAAITLEEIKSSDIWDWAKNIQNEGKLIKELADAKKTLTPFLNEFVSIEPSSVLELKGQALCSHEFQTFLDDQGAFITLKSRLDLMSEQHKVNLRKMKKQNCKL